MRLKIDDRRRIRPTVVRTLARLLASAAHRKLLPVRL